MATIINKYNENNEVLVVSGIVCLTKSLSPIYFCALGVEVCSTIRASTQTAVNLSIICDNNANWMLVASI